MGENNLHQYVQSSNELLRKRGYRLTQARDLILHVLQEADEHLSISQILERARKHQPRINLATVYRTLELLKELELVHESHLPGEQVKYEVLEGKGHHHLVCRRCQAVIHLDPTLLGNLNEQLQEQYHFHNMILNLVAAGYCQTCWNAIDCT